MRRDWICGSCRPGQTPLELGIVQRIEEKKDARGRGDVLRAGRIGAVARRLEMLARVIVKNDREILRLVARIREIEDERFRQRDLAAQARQGLVHGPFEFRLGEHRFLRRRGREKLRLHLIQDDVGARVGIAKGDAELLKKRGLQDLHEHAQVVGFAGRRRADDRKNEVRHVEKTLRQLPPAVRAGEIGRRDVHGVDRLPAIIEAGGVEALQMFVPEDGIAAQRGVDRDIHGVAAIELQPADRAGEFAILGVDLRRRRGGRGPQIGVRETSRG